jgi:membrane protein YdbS with pleckstrin-like domain
VDQPALLTQLSWRSPSPRMWLARQSVLGLSTLVVVAAVATALAIAGSAVHAVAGAAVVLAAAASTWSLLRRRYLAWGYVERADDLLVRRGLMFRRMSVVPYGRMQFIDVTAGPVDRVFGLATVQLHTAAAASDARIPGLAAAEAQRLRDRLAALGESQAAGL